MHTYYKEEKYTGEQNHVRDAMSNYGMYRSDALVNVSCGLCW